MRIKSKMNKNKIQEREINKNKCKGGQVCLRNLDLSLANITKGVLAADIYEGQSDPSSAN